MQLLVAIAGRNCKKIDIQEEICGRPLPEDKVRIKITRDPEVRDLGSFWERVRQLTQAG